jgi:uncharacterized protein (DUF1697 family)
VACTPRPVAASSNATDYVSPMPSYVAFLRGITPSNPSMSNANLRGVADSLGHGNVRTLLSSGNVIFESDDTDVASLEAAMESAWRAQLGFESTTIVRSADDIQRLVDLEPYGEREHNRKTYLLVTFAKRPLSVDFDYPYQPEDKEYWILGGTDRELFGLIDTTSATSPDLMSWLDNRFGKEISSRTWLTVNRVLAKLAPDVNG